MLCKRQAPTNSVNKKTLAITKLCFVAFVVFIIDSAKHSFAIVVYKTLLL